MKDGKSLSILANYVNSFFQDIESVLRTEVDMVKDDVRWVLVEYNSGFITYEVQPCFYFFKDISEALFNVLQTEYQGPSNVIVIEFDDINMKTKLVVTSGIIAL